MEMRLKLRGLGGENPRRLKMCLGPLLPAGSCVLFLALILHTNVPAAASRDDEASESFRNP